MRILYAFIAGGSLLSAGLVGPAVFGAPELSSVTAESVRVRSVVRRSSSTRGVYVGSGRSSRSSSSRYSSGGGFSFGK